MSQVKRVVVAAACAALGIVLPMAFHALPGAGNVWLPMHIPVMICGLVAGPVAGAATGVLAPVLSSLLTGMPAAPILPSMACELVAYGLVSGLLARFVRTGRLAADLYVSLVGAMIVGRLVGGALQALIFSQGAYSLAAWVSGYFVTALERAGLVDARYPGKE